MTATGTGTVTFMKQRVPVAAAAHQPVELAGDTAKAFVQLVNIIGSVMAVGNRRRHVGPAGGEVVRVHFTRDRVLKEHSVRPSRSRHHQTQPEGRCQCQREWDRLVVFRKAWSIP